MNLMYVFEKGDAILQGTFLLLTCMSCVSWYLIFWKSWALKREKNRIKLFHAAYVSAIDWPQHHAVFPQAQGACKLLAEQLASMRQYAQQQESLQLHLSQALDKIRVWMDRGLTPLASIGSSAPFIGLFGTVWGIYNALMHIASAGNASLNVVAGPMGEALVMTALGLFTAIPAVLAYNLFVRANRLLAQDVRHIAEQFVYYRAQEQRTASESFRVVAGGR